MESVQWRVECNNTIRKQLLILKGHMELSFLPPVLTSFVFPGWLCDILVPVATKTQLKLQEKAVLNLKSPGKKSN